MTTTDLGGTRRELDPRRLQRLSLLSLLLTVGVQSLLHEPLLGRSPLDLALLPLLIWIAVLTVAHELAHGAGFLLAGARWADLEFGLEWRRGYAWAGCGAPLPAEDYRRSLLLPGALTGALPWAVGLVGGHPELAVAGAALTAGAAGDVVLWWWARGLPSGTVVRDLTDAIGFEVASPDPGQRSRRS